MIGPLKMSKSSENLFLTKYLEHLYFMDLVVIPSEN